MWNRRGVFPFWGNEEPDPPEISILEEPEPEMNAPICGEPEPEKSVPIYIVEEPESEPEISIGSEPESEPEFVTVELSDSEFQIVVDLSNSEFVTVVEMSDTEPETSTEGLPPAVHLNGTLPPDIESDIDTNVPVGGGAEPVHENGVVPMDELIKRRPSSSTKKRQRKRRREGTVVGR